MLATIEEALPNDFPKEVLEKEYSVMNQAMNSAVRSHLYEEQLEAEQHQRELDLENHAMIDKPDEVPSLSEDHQLGVSQPMLHETLAEKTNYENTQALMNDFAQQDLRCEYDPYHLHGLDSGTSHELYKEFYDAEDAKFHTGHMAEGEDMEDEIPFEMVDDEMGMFDYDEDM